LTRHHSSRQFEVPAFPRAVYTIVVEPVHGGAFMTLQNEAGEILERCAINLSPVPRWFPFRIVRWGPRILKAALRTHFAPPCGWEVLEEEVRFKRKRKPAEVQA